jgi:hypothetical protein
VELMPRLPNAERRRLNPSEGQAVTAKGIWINAICGADLVRSTTIALAYATPADCQRIGNPPSLIF